MRLIPLIPLLLLALGAGLIELLTLERALLTPHSFSAVINEARVVSSTPEIQAKFHAVELELSEQSNLAREPDGVLTLASDEYQFRANRLHSAAHTKELVLQGGVELAQGEITLRSDRAVIDNDGLISGDNPEVKFAEGTASASSFLLDADGEIKLAGQFRGRLRL